MVSPQAFSGQPRARRFSATAWVAVQNAVEGTTQVSLFLQLLFLLLPLFLLPFWRATNQATNHCQFQSGGCPRSALRPAHAQIWAIKSKHQSNAKAKTPKHTHKQHAQNVCHSLSPKTFRAASSSWSGFLSHGVARPDGNMSTEKESRGGVETGVRMRSCWRKVLYRGVDLCCFLQGYPYGPDIASKAIAWAVWCVFSSNQLSQKRDSSRMCCHTKETIGFQRITLFSGLALSWSQVPACATHKTKWLKF